MLDIILKVFFSALVCGGMFLKIWRLNDTCLNRLVYNVYSINLTGLQCFNWSCNFVLFPIDLVHLFLVLANLDAWVLLYNTSPTFMPDTTAIDFGQMNKYNNWSSSSYSCLIQLGIEYMTFFLSFLHCTDLSMSWSQESYTVCFYRD